MFMELQWELLSLNPEWLWLRFSSRILFRGIEKKSQKFLHAFMGTR